MAKITITGSPAFDGEWEIPERMTYGELFDIEQAVGVNAGPIAALLGSLWIGIRRVKPEVKFEDLRDIPFDPSQIVEDDASPPAVGPVGGAELDGSTIDRRRESELVG
jgi:hypothetical protein